MQSTIGELESRLTPGRAVGVLVVIGYSAAGGLGVALAQDAARAEQPTLQEIVVTAQKRAESVQDVPIAISAFDSGFVERAGMLDAKAVINFTPSLAGQQKSSFTDTVTLRGIGSTNFGVGSDPAIGIYKDNIYQGRAPASTGMLFDTARIEVLRGPQAFLFGRHATAGAIHVITAEPDTAALGGYATLGIGERDRLDVEGALNIPLSGDWALRVAGATRTEDGFVDNVFGGGRVSVIEYDSQAARASLLYAGDELRVRLTGEYENRDDTSTVYSALDGNGALITGDARTIDSEFGADHPDKSEIWGVSLQVDYSMPGATLTSVTSYREHSWTYAEDSDGLPVRLANYLQDQDGRTWSQELRLVSNAEGRLRWFVGANAYSERVNAQYGLQADEDAMCGLFLAGDLSVGCVDSFPLVFGIPFPGVPGTLLESGIVRGNYSGYGAYADATFAVTNQFDIGLGLRYSHDRKKFRLNAPLAASPLAPFQLGYFTPVPISDRRSWDELSPRLTVTFRPTEATMLYGSVTKGYKSGGFDMFTAVAPDGSNFLGGPTPPGSVPNSFGPEKVWSFEAGMKSTLLDNRLQFSATAFHYRYTDLQFASAEALGQLIVRNVGKVKGKGVEIDLRAIPTRPLELYVGAAYIDTSVSGVPAATCGIASCDGNRLPYQSRWKATAGAIATFPVGRGGAEWFTSVDAQYQGSWFGEISNLPLTREGSYTVVNARIGARSGDRRWEAALYVQNAFDEQWFDGRILLFTGPTAFGPSHPRTFGGTVTFRLGQ